MSGANKRAGMSDFTAAFHTAFTLIGSFDAELRGIVLLSLAVSLTASACAFAIGAPLGTALAVYRFPGRGALIVLANALLGLPIVIALVHRPAVGHWHAYGEALLVDGASRLRTIWPLMNIGRDGLLTAFLAAFGRAIAEVGAIIIVGGNIRGYTRTMTTAIALETSKGDLSLALALGMILILLSMTVSAVSLFFGRALAQR